jgi:hypothetical protein
MAQLKKWEQKSTIYIQLVYINAHHQMVPLFQNFTPSGQNSLFGSLTQKPTPPWKYINFFNLCNELTEKPGLRSKWSPFFDFFLQSLRNHLWISSFCWNSELKFSKIIVTLNLRVSRSLIWHFLDIILAKHGVKDIIQISQFVELAFMLRKTCVKTFFHEYTPRQISKTGRPKPKRKFYLLWGYILK